MTDYFVDRTLGLDANPGTELAPWQSIDPKVNGETFAAGDRIKFKKGEVWRETLNPLSSGASGNLIVFEDYGFGARPNINASENLTTATYRWVASGSGTNEWYVELSGGGDPGITDRGWVFIDDAGGSENKGTLGSLADHEWAYGDNDTLGFSTIYVADATGDPDSSGVLIETSTRFRCIDMQGGETFIKFSGLKMGKSYNDAIFGTSGAGFEVDNCVFEFCLQKHIGYNDAATDSGAVHIHHSTFRYSGGSAIQGVAGCPGWIIEDSIFDSNCRDVATNNSASVKINTALQTSNNWIVQRNLIHNDTLGKLTGGTNRDMGVWFDGVTSQDGTQTTGHIVRYNLIRDLLGYGIHFEICNDSQAYYNVVYDCTGPGIAISRWVNDNEAYNNTVSGCLNAIFVTGQSGQADSCTGNLIKNNIGVSSVNETLQCINGGENDGTVGLGNVYQSNCFGPEAVNFIKWGIGVTPDTYDEWEALYEPSNSVEADPLFADAANDNFHLQPASPCINAGVDVGLTQDRIGTPVPIGPRPDMGAYESGTTLMGAGAM